MQRRAGPLRLVAWRLIATGLALIAVSNAVLIPRPPWRDNRRWRREWAENRLLSDEAECW